MVALWLEESWGLADRSDGVARSNWSGSFGLIVALNFVLEPLATDSPLMFVLGTRSDVDSTITVLSAIRMA